MSQRELVSVSEANRPSIDQMLPTRYSQLLLDSQRQSSTNKNRQVNLLMLTPTGGSSSYLTRKKRLLDEHLGGDHSGTSKMQRSNAPPFERPSSGLESIDYRDEEEMIFNESTVKEDEYGQEVPSKAISQMQHSVSDSQENACSWMQYLAGTDSEELKTPVRAKESHLHPVSLAFSVTDGVYLDKATADRWLTNEDQLRPKVIVDEDEDDNNTSMSNFD